MQREFLPTLVDAFPEAQFVIATHSPFIVSSVRNASVYAFDVEDETIVPGAVAEDLSASRNAVVTSAIDLGDRTSAGEVLRKVLGVPITVPIWAERELDEIVEPFKGRDFSSADIRQLHAALVERGLDDFLPDAVARAAERNA
jgi:hypothetical protein